MKLVLGFSGRSEHGKTISCEAIRDHVTKRGGVAKIYSISDLIIRYCIGVGLLPVGFKRGPHNTKEEIKILVDTGNRRRAEHGETVWVEEFVTEMKSDSGVDVAMCPNLRFVQEARAVQTIPGGYIIRMTRKNADGSIFISQSRNPNDITETSLEFWPADFEIVMKDGHEALTSEFAITLYEYIAGLHE